MLLHLIKTDPRRFQFRDTEYSDKTVTGIVAEGIKLAKFDAIPVLMANGDCIVAGDGHSRFEAIKRLAAENRLPDAWRRGKTWDIPVRQITETEAQSLAWTANLSRADFTPCEEAKVFQSMLDSGMSLEAVAKLAHRSTAYIRATLPLTVLCRDIRAAMSLSPDAGGVEVFIGKLMAAKFQQYKIGHAAQSELWHRVLKNADLTASFVRALLDRIGQTAKEKDDGGADNFLFAIPASVTQTVMDMRDKAQHLRRAERGLAWLLQCKDSGVLDEFGELKKLLDRSGPAILKTIKGKTEQDAAVIARMCGM